MMPDTRYLERHGSQWRVRVKVPEALREIIGKAHLVAPLHTDSLAEANRRKHRIVADFHETIERARKQARAGHSPLVEDALRWREALNDEASNPPTTVVLDEASGEEVEVTDPIVPALLSQRADEVAKSEGQDQASLFLKIASGAYTPLLVYVDPWLTERHDFKPRQALDYRRAVVKFAAWCEGENLPSAIEAVSAKVAGAYLSSLASKGTAPRTANKDLTALRVYWRWLVPRGHALANPWLGISMRRPKYRDDSERPKRDFTDEEIVRLVTGIEDDTVSDAVVISALMGLRVEEIARLRVGDCVHGAVQIRAAKTPAGNRLVPIHPDVAAVIATRTVGKPPSAWLFSELSDVPAHSARERGQPITKRFGRARIRLGVDERIEGARQSRVDFHSLRRWFISTARRALQRGAQGYDMYTVAAVVGHDLKSVGLGLDLTVGTYARPDSLEARRACVAAVQLPEPARRHLCELEKTPRPARKIKHPSTTKPR